MDAKNRMGVVVALSLFAAVCTGACKKSSEAEREAVGKAEVHSSEVANEADKARTELSEKKNDYLTAVRREQLELRGKVQAEIDNVDKKLLAHKVNLRSNDPVAVPSDAKEAKQIEELLARRQQLESNVSLIERSDERGWDEIKATIERDLSRGPGKI